MAGDPLQKVQPGDNLDRYKSAETFNCFIDAAADFKARTQGLRRKTPDITPQRTVIPVKNMTGGVRNRFDVAAIGQSIFDINGDAGKERPAAFGLKPDPASDLGKIAVFISPAGVGDIARCCVSGVTVARVSVLEKWHRWADFKKDECQYLESRAEPGGAYILWPTGQTGTLMCLVRISNPPPVHFAAKITAVEALGGNRYKYTFAENAKTGALHAGWTAKAEGRSGFAYNLVETVGDATCVPAKIGETVWIDEVRFTDVAGDEALEYWFQYEEYDQTKGESSGDYTTIIVYVPTAYNRCGQYIMIPKKTLRLPPGTQIIDAGVDAVPIYQCQSTGDEPPISYGDQDPPDSGFDVSDWSWDLYADSLTVSGTLSPDATGVYTFSHWFNGRPVWRKVLGDTNWVIYWSDYAGCWMLYGGDPGNSWHKAWPPLEDPIGQWNPGANADGIATVSVTP